MVHNRECPKCGKIVPWTKGKLKTYEMYNGTKVKAKECTLVCPEHGLFEPRAHERLREYWGKV